MSIFKNEISLFRVRFYFKDFREKVDQGCHRPGKLGKLEKVREKCKKVEF